MYNLRGELIQTITTDQELIEVDISQTSAGIYYLLINVESRFIGTTFIKK